ncbi:MAG: hypothetical protein A3I89_04230 [Candidatus Harrisonbacteria bacterium RIFCSPLOWO2_02_FULL_41_11]|uniref:Glycosyltransferase RgtA/B/C/D-like domain-containing protein n=1 Tax=Candidatus Harrisonbacteria bacterium RIFCSPHIGHO2_02_FULL_42_16 TaxID=1798404 RepID=A0A1G1ZHS4_9BACT|nr:MAG: hypothetical protein A3B92_01285 [Candidatus Harrisonbacteria bacterium RIFCSPHIGHO2_02_FULL_42_16]OGY67183.1 MAG: hypothetical protein A3I89_04230 [Candidatus Harrisonbacteria bacterium RIFCSPLOWO2_02_FULL_41_11]
MIGRLGLKHYIFLIIAAGIFSAGFHGLGLFKSVPWHLVYSDTLGFFEKAAAPGFPYLQKQIEYPVLTGWFIHWMGALGQSRAGYYFWSALFLIIFAAVATGFLYRIAEDKRRLLVYWIFAPSMLVFSAFNWDILALLFVILAFYFMSRDKDGYAAFFLALGFSSKLYPILYLIPLLLKKNNVRELAKLAGIFFITALAVNGIFMLANFDGWSYFYTLNSARNSNPDSIWSVIRFLFGDISIPSINVISFILFGASYAAFMRKFRKVETLQLCFGATLIFLLFNKVFTPQYLMWLLPFWVLLPELKFSSKLFYALEFSNLGAFFSILPWFFLGHNMFYFYLASPFVILRHFFLAVIIYQLLKKRG